MWIAARSVRVLDVHPGPGRLYSVTAAALKREPNPKLVELGERLRIARKAKGMTQAALAQQVDLSRAALIRIEQGAQEVGVLNLRHLAEALDVSVGQLVD